MESIFSNGGPRGGLISVNYGTLDLKKCKPLLFTAVNDSHKKGHGSDDSACVISMMELRLVRVLHRCVDDDPPPGEELK